jgi:hypothetical protein
VLLGGIDPDKVQAGIDSPFIDGVHVPNPTYLIEWASHSQLASIQHRRVDHGGFHGLMLKQFLDGPDVVTLLA